jgi:hypothetical protein
MPWSCGLLLLAGHDALVDLALEAGRERDDPLAVPAQQLLVDPRLVVEAFEVGLRGQLDEVAVAGLAGGEQHQVVAAPLAGGAVEAVALGDVRFDAEDRFDPRLARQVVELDGAEHVAMVGQRHSRHARRGRGADDLVEAVGAVQQAVLAVKVEVDEVCHRASEAMLPEPGARSGDVALVGGAHGAPPSRLSANR